MEVSETLHRANNMRTCCTATILICSVVTSFLVPPGSAAEVRLVHSGSTVTLSCNVSYLYDTTWLKQNPGLQPTVVLCASLREGHPHAGCGLSPRHSVVLVNRSLALRISGAEEGDLGLYFCVGHVNERLTVGKAFRLCGDEEQPPVTRDLCGSGGSASDSPPQNSSWFVFPHWYVAAVASSLFFMVLTVSIIHWKTTKQEVEINTSTCNEANL